MKRKKHIIRLVCRKEKKAIKNYPCPKTKWGRYIIDVINSKESGIPIGIGWYNGEIIYSDGRNEFEHPLGQFYNNRINGLRLWRQDDELLEKWEKQMKNNEGGER